MNACYVHIPFCDSICYYCDFCRVANQKTTRHLYIQALKQEIKEANLPKLDTLYFGGGTPSVLTKEEFIDLASCFQLKEDYEFTIEANPDSLTEEKISAYIQQGVNRISLGVQTFSDSLLKSIGRKHTSQQVFQSISLLKEKGLDNISIDLIFALPNQTMEDVQKDVETFLNLNINHLSIYSLQIEENSIFGKQGLQSIDSDLEEEMYDWICMRLKQAGYQHYEISSFCKPNKQSRHNLVYWSDQDFFGLGCGASGCVNGNRYDNTNQIQSYLEKGSQPDFIEESLEDKSFNAIMMGLRTSYGVNIEQWNKKYSMDLEKKYHDVIEKYPGLTTHNNYLVCDEDSRKILHTILIDFLSID